MSLKKNLKIKENKLKYLIKKSISLLEKNGYGVIHPSQYRSDMEKDFLDLWEKVKQYTMISPERGYNIYKSVEYICRNNIPGDFVECGVWKGGACMLIAFSLMKQGAKERKIILYDTFKGMTKPSEKDCIAWSGSNMLERWFKSMDRKGNSMWAADIEEVRGNMHSTGYSKDLMEFNMGDVCEVLDRKTPKSISLLRLDTDWYESTRKELEVLYPLLSKGGVLVIDDYGHFTGAKKAVDEYFSEKKEYTVYLSRIDYTGRAGIKI